MPTISLFRSNIRKSSFVANMLLLAGCANNSPPECEPPGPTVEYAQASELFRPGISAPIDVLYYESAEAGAAYYITKLTMTTATRGLVVLEKFGTNEPVAEFYLDVEHAGIRPTRPHPDNEDISDFAIDAYSKWCGKWHKGINNYWKLCGGSDCSGTGSVQWCIKKVDKEACQLADNCPTND